MEVDFKVLPKRGKEMEGFIFKILSLIKLGMTPKIGPQVFFPCPDKLL